MRLVVYWVSALLSTVMFVVVVSTLLIVPGVLQSTKIWMLSGAGSAAVISLCIGLWRFNSTDAPASSWPFGPFSIVILLLEIVECAGSVVQLARQAHP